MRKPRGRDVLVDSHLSFNTEGLDPEWLDELKTEFTHSNPKWHKAKAMGFRPPASEPKTYRTYQEQGAELRLPRGGVARLRNWFAEHGIDYRFADHRVAAKPVRHLPAHRVELWEHQREAVDAVLRYESGIIRSPTGSGKTTAAIAAAVEVGLQTLIVVWSSNLFEQWRERLVDELGLKRSEVGTIRGAKATLKPITIAMQQTLNSRGVAPIAHEFGAVFCDEVQRFAAKTFMATIDALPARYRIGISDDETRADKKEFLIYDTFGPVIAEIDRDELIERGVIHDVEIIVVPTPFDHPPYRAARDAGATPDFNGLLEAMTEARERNDRAADLVAMEVANGRQALVFSHRVEHCLRLDAALAARDVPSGVMLGGEEFADRFSESRAMMISGRQRAAVGTIQAIGQGMDIKSVDRGVLATPIASNRQLMRQVTGRLCRAASGKADAALYVLHDSRVFGDYPILNLLRWYKRVNVLTSTGKMPAREWLDLGG